MCAYGSMFAFIPLMVEHNCCYVPCAVSSGSSHTVNPGHQRTMRTPV